MLTDPPYNAINRDTNGLRIIDKGAADSASINPMELAGLFWTASTGSVYVWCSDEQYTEWSVAFKQLGAATRICVWHKTNPSPMNGEHLWLSALELCVFAKHPGGYYSRFCEHPVWSGAIAPANGHPTPKPEWLMQRLIQASCPAKGVVLDPFMGGGATLRAAKDLNCRAIGIEIEEKYCEIAAKRLKQEVLIL